MSRAKSHLSAFAESAAYADVAREFRAAGGSGVTMVRCDLTAGLRRRPAADEFCLPLVMSTTCRQVTIDHGVRFQGERPPAMRLLLAPKRTDLSYDIDGLETVLVAVLPERFLRSALSVNGGHDWPGDFGALHGCFFSDRTISELMQRMWREAVDQVPENGLLADTVWASVAALLLRASGQSLSKPANGGLAGWQLRRVTEHVQDRLSEDVSLGEMAGLVGLSPRHFCTAFRQSTGLPPHRWQIERRIERAKNMLADPGATVTKVALACGFSTPSHFANTFSRVVGCSPSRWRRDRLE